MISVTQHIEELKNILSYSKNIGFFFGAGTSCSFGLPDIADLTCKTEAKLDQDDKNIMIKIVSLIKKVYSKEYVTIEDILNYVRQIKDITGCRDDLSHEGINGSTAKSLEQKICTNIYNILVEMEGTTSFKELRDFFVWYSSHCVGNKKEVFTTNYDMLIEQALETSFIPYFDGFCGGYEPFFNPKSIEANLLSTDITVDWIRLWKLHGSLNWVLKKGNDSTKERIIRIGKTESVENELMIYPSREKYNLSRKEPYIAYFDRLKRYLKEGELLFITSGYSFLDDHINDVLFSSLQQNNRLHIVALCYTDEQVELMQKYTSSMTNLCVMGPKKVITNTILYGWALEKSSDTPSDTSTYWNKDAKELTIGDFKKLVPFLMENSIKIKNCQVHNYEE